MDITNRAHVVRALESFVAMDSTILAAKTTQLDALQAILTRPDFAAVLNKQQREQLVELAAELDHAITGIRANIDRNRQRIEELLKV